MNPHNETQFPQWHSIRTPFDRLKADERVFWENILLDAKRKILNSSFTATAVPQNTSDADYARCFIGMDNW